MALRGLLLLCVVASELWGSDTKPVDFVCDRAARRAMSAMAEMQSALTDCDASLTLATPIRLPCSELHVTSWENKSHQEKRGDIAASLRLLVEGVKVVRSLSQTGCGAPLLQRLEHNANNYLLILTHLHLSGPVEVPVLSCVPRSSQSLSSVLLSYKRLITGKLERFMVDLEDGCSPQ